MRYVALLALLLLHSCGTIMSPAMWSVPVDSDPAGATVYYQGAAVGVTPCVVPVKRRSQQLELELAGHHRQPVALRTSMNGWLFGNILLGGVVGILIDLASGGSWVVQDHPIKVPLVPDSMPAPDVPFIPASTLPPRAGADVGHPRKL